MKQLRLKEFRKKQKMSQLDVARHLEITQSMYSRFEIGKSFPNSQQIIKLCEIFDCTPNDLFGIEGAMSAAFDPLFQEYKELREKLKK